VLLNARGTRDDGLAMEARMTLRIHNALGAAAFALVALGCKKDPCDGTNFKNPEAGFCLKMPNGFVAKPVRVLSIEKRQSFDRDNPNSSFSVSWGSKETLPQAEAFIGTVTSDKDNVVKGKGDLPDKKGKFYHITYKSSGTHEVRTYVQGATNLFECQAQSAEEHAQEVVDACMSVAAIAK
jgi:hypothetical protein